MILLEKCTGCGENMMPRDMQCQKCGAARPAKAVPAGVVITGIKVPLMDLFWLMVKWTVASLLPLLVLILFWGMGQSILHVLMTRR